MSRLLSTLALLIAFDVASARTLELLETAAELTLDKVTLPNAVGGTVNYRECVDCAISPHYTTAATVFAVNGRILSLTEFLRVVADLRAQPGKEESSVVTVFRDIASGNVTRVTLFAE